MRTIRAAAGKAERASEGAVDYERALTQVRAEVQAARQAERAGWSDDLQKLASAYFDVEVRGASL